MLSDIEKSLLIPESIRISPYLWFNMYKNEGRIIYFFRINEFIRRAKAN